MHDSTACSQHAKIKYRARGESLVRGYALLERFCGDKYVHTHVHVQCAGYRVGIFIHIQCTCVYLYVAPSGVYIKVMRHVSNDRWQVYMHVHVCVQTYVCGEVCECEQVLFLILKTRYMYLDGSAFSTYMYSTTQGNLTSK